jgi:hypothetical protein
MLLINGANAEEDQKMLRETIEKVEEYRWLGTDRREGSQLCPPLRRV